MQDSEAHDTAELDYKGLETLKHSNGTFKRNIHTQSKGKKW